MEIKENVPGISTGRYQPDVLLFIIRLWIVIIPVKKSINLELISNPCHRYFYSHLV